MSKKLLVALSSMVVLNLLLVGCGGTQPTVTEPPATAAPTPEELSTEVPDEVKPTTELPTQEPTLEPTEKPILQTTRVGGWLDTITMSVVNAGSAVSQIKEGAIDIYASGLATASDAAAISVANLDHSNEFGLYYEITFNPVGPTTEDGKLNPFYSAKIREAMNWLIDRDYINQEIYGGIATPMFVPILPTTLDYSRNIEAIKQLEGKYAYNLEKANQVITAEMKTLGAQLVDGKWNYEGKPVVLVFLIRTDSDGTRLPMGNIISNWLEEIGFTIDQVYGTTSTLGALWEEEEPALGGWHMYTGAWEATGISRNDGDNFQEFYSPASSHGSSPLWQAYDLDDDFLQLTKDLANNNFNTLEKRADMFAEAAADALEYSFRIWVVSGSTQTPWRPRLTVSYDLGAGVDSSRLWPYTLRYKDQEGGLVKWGGADLFVQPVNPLGGSNWSYDRQYYDAASDFGVLLNPFTGVALPQRIERAEVVVRTGLPVSKTYDWVDLSFEDKITVPGDTWIDWDIENQVWLTVGEVYPDGLTAKTKSVVYYPPELWDITWHDGSKIDLADFIMPQIMRFETGNKDSDLYDESQAPRLEAFKLTFKGIRITSITPLVIEYYSDNWTLDAESIVTTMFPQYGFGTSPWHMIAVSNLAESTEELAYTTDKADHLEIEWMNYLGGPSLNILESKLDQLIVQNLIPFEPTLGQFVAAESAAARYANLKAFYKEHGHFYVGTGPYMIDDVRLTEKTLTLVHNPNFPDLADKWNIFSSPKMAEVAVDGAVDVSAGAEATFDTFVTFEGEVYPNDEIDQVKYLLYGPEGTLVATGMADLVTDGHYLITLSQEITGQFVSGDYKLEAVVISKLVAIPSFVTFEFIVE
jgi:peptide/nickel transport system substrate-binding protein